MSTNNYSAAAFKAWQSPDTLRNEEFVRIEAKRKKRVAAVFRKAHKKLMEQFEQNQIERDYRQHEHDLRMMWVRENDGTNQCIPANGWATLLNRIAN